MIQQQQIKNKPLLQQHEPASKFDGSFPQNMAIEGNPDIKPPIFFYAVRNIFFGFENRWLLLPIEWK
ncbi:hypothetical protein [Pelagibaculum spongiae]|uniref:hypothetical protein n=1 Tax=Pelagibaculum spongiae TaxID=2080658 RepID=UPI000E324A2F|nr:hypothetical protein [Pelagibaculum spongiae]